MLKVAIVENESEQSELLAGYVARYARESGEECAAVTFVSGLDFLSDYSGDFDAVFMDIKMPMMDGMTVAGKLRELDEHVPLVFVTNMAQFAIKGYKVGAMDFLVKPVGYFDFSLELKKISRIKERSSGDFIWLTASGALKRVPLADISYVEIMNHNVSVHTDGEVISFRGTLKEIEEKLAGKFFSRCDNCFIVSLRRVAGVEGDIVHMDSGEELHISRLRKKNFLADLTAFIASEGIPGGGCR